MNLNPLLNYDASTGYLEIKSGTGWKPLHLTYSQKQGELVATIKGREYRASDLIYSIITYRNPNNNAVPHARSGLILPPGPLKYKDGDVMNLRAANIVFAAQPKKDNLYFNRRDNKWQIIVPYKGERVYLGSYRSVHEAEQVDQQAALIRKLRRRKNQLTSTEKLLEHIDKFDEAFTAVDTKRRATNKQQLLDLP